ncbi:MAG: GntR family transcriptional regulator [Pseudomonadota bacterium]
MIFRREAEKDRTVVEMLASALRRDISFGALLPDEKLKIGDLRARYGGSNHSMRESLRLLSAEGLVAATAQRGFRVMSATQSDVLDIALVRGEIGKIALARSIAYGDVAWEGRVIAAHHALRRTEEAVSAAPDDLNALEWDEACRAFAASLVEACESPRLIDLHRTVFDQSRRMRLALMREGRLNWTVRALGQKALLEAVLARNAPAACTAYADDIQTEIDPQK